MPGVLAEGRRVQEGELAEVDLMIEIDSKQIILQVHVLIIVEILHGTSHILAENLSTLMTVLNLIILVDFLQVLLAVGAFPGTSLLSTLSVLVLMLASCLLVLILHLPNLVFLMARRSGRDN